MCRFYSETPASMLYFRLRAGCVPRFHDRSLSSVGCVVRYSRIRLVRPKATHSVSLCNCGVQTQLENICTPTWFETGCLASHFRVNNEMKHETGLLSLAEELRSYILSFLSCRDILRCASVGCSSCCCATWSFILTIFLQVCKALHQMYMSSSELQYIVEMSGQRLLHVSNTDNGIPASARLQLLRDKAHAWFKVDIHSFETVLIKWARRVEKEVVAGGHACLWDCATNAARIFPILSKPSQRQFQRNWPPGTLCSVPHSVLLDLVMDPAQNLIAVAYIVDNIGVYIKLGALDSDEVHPQAAGETLFLLDDPRSFHQRPCVKLKCFGRHIALWCRFGSVAWGSMDDDWLLQVWDWKHSTTSSVRFGMT
jgi:hypothetical protein